MKRMPTAIKHQRKRRTQSSPPIKLRRRGKAALIRSRLRTGHSNLNNSLNWKASHWLL